MTSAEQKNEFLILYDKLTNFDAPGYDDEEISIFLTKAQERVVLDIINPISNKNRTGFEETEARRKDLRELVQNATPSASATQTGVLPNGEFFDLPANCLYVISEEIVADSDDACIDGTRIRVKPITHDYYTINKNNPFKKPNKQFAWRLDFNTGRNEIITSPDYTVGSYNIRYIKRLNPIITAAGVTVDGVSGVQNCQLDAIFHKRIVDEAVKIATGVTNPESYQIKTVEQKEAEQ